MNEGGVAQCTCYEGFEGEHCESEYDRFICVTKLIVTVVCTLTVVVFICI